MWIFCCGMRRSGSTLQFQITARLVEEAGLGKRVAWVKPELFGKLRKQMAGEKGWKVFKSHVCTDKMAAEFQNGAKGVYCYRDPRDVFVSTMRKYDMAFDELFERGFLQELLRQYNRWTALPRVLISKYETLKADLPSEIARIAAHLGIAIDAASCAEIASDFSIDRQRQRIEEAKRAGRLKAGFVNAQFDPETNLHTNHIHTGAIDGWKDVLTREQVGMIESIASAWLSEHGYEIDGAPE